MKEKKKSDFSYVEPISYFPKSVRKKLKLGEYAEETKNDKKATK